MYDNVTVVEDSSDVIVKKLLENERIRRAIEELNKNVEIDYLIRLFVGVKNDYEDISNVKGEVICRTILHLYIESVKEVTENFSISIEESFEKHSADTEHILEMMFEVFEEIVADEFDRGGYEIYT